MQPASVKALTGEPVPAGPPQQQASQFQRQQPNDLLSQLQFSAPAPDLIVSLAGSLNMNRVSSATNLAPIGPGAPPPAPYQPPLRGMNPAFHQLQRQQPPQPQPQPQLQPVSAAWLVPDAKVWMYLVYLKYWTLFLRPLMVYPKVLFHPHFSITVARSNSLSLLAKRQMRSVCQAQASAQDSHNTLVRPSCIYSFQCKNMIALSSMQSTKFIERLIGLARGRCYEKIMGKIAKGKNSRAKLISHAVLL